MLLQDFVDSAICKCVDGSLRDHQFICIIVVVIEIDKAQKFTKLVTFIMNSMT